MGWNDLNLKKFNILDLIRKRSAESGYKVPNPHPQTIPRKAKDVKTLDEMNKLFGEIEHE